MSGDGVWWVVTMSNSSNVAIASVLGAGREWEEEGLPAGNPLLLSTPSPRLLPLYDDSFLFFLRSTVRI